MNSIKSSKLRYLYNIKMWEFLTKSIFGFKFFIKLLMLLNQNKAYKLIQLFFASQA